MSEIDVSNKNGLNTSSNTLDKYNNYKNYNPLDIVPILN